MLRRTGWAAVSGLAAGGVVLANSQDARVAIGLDSGLPSVEGLVRFSRTAFNVAVTAADYKWTLRGLDKEKDVDAYKAALAKANARAARRLFNVCYKHGGLYTKFGQGVANLNHALPSEFISALAPLQDRAKEMSSKQALDLLEEELGKDVFAKFDEKPIAAASLAQVHRAVLRRTGETVAVKLQYPYLEKQTEGDLATLRFITDFVGFWFPEFSYSWLTPEFENNMALELDFRQEARNSERLAHMFASRSDVYVPRIYWGLTTKRVLTMEFVDAIKINHVEALEAAKVNPLQVANTVSSIFGDMIHVHGFVHCDPHAGNLAVLPESGRSAAPVGREEERD